MTIATDTVVAGAAVNAAPLQRNGIVVTTNSRSKAVIAIAEHEPNNNTETSYYCPSSSMESVDPYCGSININKRSESIGGNTLSTMAESEYSLFFSEKSFKVDTSTSLKDSPPDDGFDDSLSSHEETTTNGPVVIENEEEKEESVVSPSNSSVECNDNHMVKKVDLNKEQDLSSHAVKHKNDSRQVQAIVTEAPEEEHVATQVTSTAVKDLPKESKKVSNVGVVESLPKETSKAASNAVEEFSNQTSMGVVSESSAAAAVETTASKSATEVTTLSSSAAPPQWTSFGMIKYRPTDRSIIVALTPSKPSLRIHSSYGKDDGKIPLDFHKRGVVKVLPKPDMKELGRQALERRASAPKSPQQQQEERRKKKKKKYYVVFDKINIREHRITMGDNPSCSYGTPISLDWDYIDFEELTLQDYEMHKITSGRGRARTLRQMYMNHYQRIQRLQEEGYSIEEIKKCKRETKKVRQQREMTRFLAQTKVLVALEDMVESAGRKMSRIGKSQNKKKGSLSKDHEKQLLLKIMEGDDTIQTALVRQTEARIRSDQRNNSGRTNDVR